MPTTTERVFKGYNGDLILGSAGATIHRGKKGIALQGAFRGYKMIPWQSIVAVQYKKASVISGVGYLQLTLRGGSETKGGGLDAAKDENSVTWSNVPRPKQKNAEFAEARDIVLARITPEQVEMKNCPDCAEEVRAAANVCRYCGHKFS